MSVRQAVRGLLITEDHKILLLKVRSPVNGASIWMTPGGGIENGETDHQALTREIWEETGLRLTQTGKFVFERNFSYRGSNGRFSQFEKYFLVFLREFTPTMQNNPAEREVSIFQDYRWWDINQISSSEDTFAPSLLGEHLDTLFNKRPDQRPIYPLNISRD
ncbi:MAG: NUDIX domain-containing protein [Pseudomonadales bacterium]|nr:NUDIX domain-containing protein [Pseudomonadales bacterium]